MLSREEEERRLELYHQGLNDKEIAKVLGLSKEAFRDWRVRRGLPANVKPKWTGETGSGTPMEQVLTPGQCEIMREFLRFCVTGWRHGADVIKLMRAYREYQSGFVYTRLKRRESA
jgi:hypothetical protein